MSQVLDKQQTQLKLEQLNEALSSGTFLQVRHMLNSLSPPNIADATAMIIIIIIGKIRTVIVFSAFDISFHSFCLVAMAPLVRVDNPWLPNKKDSHAGLSRTQTSSYAYSFLRSCPFYGTTTRPSHVN